MFFWIIFYIITLALIAMFFINEKYLIEKINIISDYFANIVSKICIKNKDTRFLKVFNIFSAIIIALIYLIYVDKSHNAIIPIREYAVFVSIAINVIFFLLNYKKGLLFVLDIAMYFVSNLLFGIEDKYFFYAMLVAIVLLLISILLENEKIKEEFRTITSGLFLFILVVIIQNHYFGNYVIPTQSMHPTIMVGDRIFSNNIKYKFSSIKLNDIISFKEPLDNSYLYTKRITGIKGTVFEVKENRVFSDDVKISNRVYSNGPSSIYDIAGAGKYYIPKKNDVVRIKYLLEYDSKEGIIRKIEGNLDFNKEVKDKDYKNSFGIYNKYDGRYKYSFILESDSSAYPLLPILDFKYNKKIMEKLLNKESITLKDDYYIAMGDNTDNSQDSRYFGYVSSNRIKGKLILRWFPINRIGILKSDEWWK